MPKQSNLTKISEFILEQDKYSSMNQPDPEFSLSIDDTTQTNMSVGIIPADRSNIYINIYQNI